MKDGERNQELLRRCEARLGGIKIPDPFDLTAFCEQLGHMYGRSIQLAPFPPEVARALAGTDVTAALWYAHGDDGVLCFRPDALEWHQHIGALHECGHILGGHRRGLDDTTPALHVQFAIPLKSHWNLDKIEMVLARHGYSDEQEQEAELTATLIEARIKRRTPSVPLAKLPPEAAAALLRLAQALGATGAAP